MTFLSLHILLHLLGISINLNNFGAFIHEMQLSIRRWFPAVIAVTCHSMTGSGLYVIVVDRPVDHSHLFSTLLVLATLFPVGIETLVLVFHSVSGSTPMTFHRQEHIPLPYPFNIPKGPFPSAPALQFHPTNDSLSHVIFLSNHREYLP